MKVIIFTETKVGEGHYQAARAVAHELEQVLDNPIKVMSGMYSIHPFLEWISVKLYFTILNIYPPLWRTIYRGIKKRSKLQTFLFAWRLMKVIQEEQPDMILCTHPACISGLDYIKEKKKFSFTLAAICTDFDFHPFFVSSQVDYFFVAHSNLKNKLIHTFGIEAHKIFDFGIPIRSAFNQSTKKKHEKGFCLHNPKEKIHLLVIGGATCFGPMEDIIHVFEPYQSYFQITMITGKNKKLYKKLTQENYSYVDVLGYVENMNEWYSRVDLVVSKPGGLTISEAIASGTPFIIFQPIPGHEEANKDFLQEQGLGVYVEDMKRLPDYILALVQNQKEWLAWKKRIKNFYKTEAAKQIVNKLILE